MIKTATFAVMHFSIAFAVVYAMTGSLLLGGAVALVEPAVNTVAFHFHEKIWKRIERRGGARLPERFRSTIRA
ncbi:DUF2061 domain-containing protein [Halopseudomonas sp.]|jgi:uncharacterized membrane protein|uniref:DUF2061 domain-containing protein n=1 Tax=Halopseudomonas sp. TaxID=2901191 RepID=UPI001A41C0DE|nr:DUF2061 domain-containing protein [Pseudomonas sp.]|tara:strand:- start:1132 stop:1350 length:219 start_codon:yes stop_codon:yes gene_type:complete